MGDATSWGSHMRWQEKQRKKERRQEETIFRPIISDSFDCICKIPLVKHAAQWLFTLQMESLSRQPL